VKFIAIPSLRWRLVAVMCVAYTLVAVSSGIVEYYSQQDNLNSQLQTRARSDAAILAAGAESPLNGSGSKAVSALQNFVFSLRRADGVIYAEVIANGRIVASTIPSQLNRVDRVPLLLGAAATARSLPNGDVQGQAPVAGSNTDVGIARVTVSGSSVPRALARSLASTFFIRLAGLIVFVLLSLTIARYVLGPLQGLVEAARAIRRGQMSTRMPEEGNTEMTTVAQAFNNMASALQQRIKYLSFLATAGSTLLTEFRAGADVQPVLQSFCRELGAAGAGLVARTDAETPDYWYGVEFDEPRWRQLAMDVAAYSPTAISLDDAAYALMIVPVLADAVFLTVRKETFTEEEQQIITNFAYQFGLAAENARLFAAQQEALQVKDQFLSIVSHELRTPLTTIKGYAQMLQRKLAHNPDDQRFANNIDAQVGRLSRLVDDLLDVTRFSRGQFELTLERTDIRSALEDVITRFRVVASKHTFRLELDGGSFEGDWDRDRLEQVMNNLVGNAVKYSPSGGEIVISTRHEQDQVVIAVRDYGVGIPEADQKHLFDRFFRGSAENTDIKGLGLGLYVSQRIVEAHGGTIGATSVPGEGSEFFFTLPLLPERVRDGAAPAKP
jgi:signal transduction histidine kinase